uniref:Desmoglein 2 n=1 Tax=Homo sapiens TaxID=9606 RepID=A0AAQ5BH32_HUMAN
MARSPGRAYALLLLLICFNVGSGLHLQCGKSAPGSPPPWLFGRERICPRRIQLPRYILILQKKEDSKLLTNTLEKGLQSHLLVYLSLTKILEN